MDTVMLENRRDKVIAEWDASYASAAEQVEQQIRRDAKERMAAEAKAEADTLIQGWVYEAIESCLDMFDAPDMLTYKLVQKFDKGNLFAAEDVVALAKAYSNDEAYSTEALAENVTAIARTYPQWPRTLRCEANGPDDVVLVDEIFQPICSSGDGEFYDLI